MARPDASIILVASEGAISLARILDRLRGQSAAARLEVIIAAYPSLVPDLRALNDTAFADLVVIEADLSTSARARAVAINQARAPVVIFAEDHSFPIRNDWAERIITAHEAPHAGVGPIMRNANPSSATSWANLVVEYGPWLGARKASEVDFLPGHNSAYKRELLLQYGDDLADMLEAEWVMQKDLRARGYTLWLDPSIEVAHLNYASVGKSLRLQFLAGLTFAASRSRTWNAPKRYLYATAAPAIVLRRLYLATGHIIKLQNAQVRGMRLLPLTVLFMLVSGIGEGIGYAFGDCGRRGDYALLEYQRWRNLLPDEIALARQPELQGKN